MSKHTPSPIRNSHSETTYSPADHSRFQSLKACLFTGWKVFADHPMRYLAWQFPGALFRGLGLTVFIWYATQLYAEHIHPAFMFWKMGATDKPVLDLFPILPRNWTFLGLCCLYALLALYLSKGYTWHKIRRTTAYNTQKQTFAQYAKSLLANSMHCFLYDAAASVINLLLIGLTVLLAWKTSWWCLLLLLPIECFVYVFTTIGRYGWMLARHPLRNLPAWTWKESKRYGGAYFLLLILTGIPYLLLCGILLLPMAVFTLAIMANAETLMTGAQSGLPDYFTYLYFAVSTLCLTFCALFASMRPWPLAFKTCYLSTASSQADSATPPPVHATPSQEEKMPSGNQEK